MGGVLAGMNVLQFAGLLDALMTFDFGMAVVDDEIAQMLKRVHRGMEVTESNLAVDEIAEIGPAGMFVSTKRTHKMMRETAILPKVADRQVRQIWEESGSEDAHARGLRLARKLLSGADATSLLPPEAEQRVRASFEGLVSGDFTMPEGW
jgi:trimethylamine--corrinoid protein Co-methyltransferase